jgi:hypothetical protein
MNTPYPEVNLFMQRLYEVYMNAKYASSVSRYHARWSDHLSKAVLGVTYLSGLALLVSGALPHLIDPRWASLIGGIVLLTVDIIRRLAENVYRHREKALAFKDVCQSLDQTFSSYEPTLVQIRKGELTEADILERARKISDETLSVWGKLPPELNLELHQEFTEDANLMSDSYFKQYHDFSTNE